MLQEGAKGVSFFDDYWCAWFGKDHVDFSRTLKTQLHCHFREFEHHQES
jgi:hypothetical protein